MAEIGIENKQQRLSYMHDAWYDKCKTANDSVNSLNCGSQAIREIAIIKHDELDDEQSTPCLCVNLIIIIHVYHVATTLLLIFI